MLWYKFLSYREVFHVVSESSELSQLSELIELPEVFSSMEKCLLHQALRLGDPLIKLLELRFVASSSETSRSSGTIQTSQSSISSHPVFPDECRSVIVDIPVVKNPNSKLGFKLKSYYKNSIWSIILQVFEILASGQFFQKKKFPFLEGVRQKKNVIKNQLLKRAILICL